MADAARSRCPGRELGALGVGTVAQPSLAGSASGGDAKPPAAAQRPQGAEPATSGGQSVQITPRTLRFVASAI
jgi:hypothetical protein